MKDYIEKVIDKKLSANDNKNRIREYIQKYLLYVLYKQKIYKKIVFCGGTALRILYNTRRYSEDMDFSLSKNLKEYNFKSILGCINKEFEAAGYNIEISYSDKKSVNGAFLKFPDILYEYGLSSHENEKLSIKIEIDTNPPVGGKEELTLYQSVYMCYILHYDIPSLFAGKMHALLCRQYTKGRDWYDLLWYLMNFRELEPNYSMLNNAIKQTDCKSSEIGSSNWKEELKKAVDAVDIKKAREDVFRFLENPDDIDMLTKENFYRQLNL